MADKALPDWDDDSPALRRNLETVFRQVEGEAARRAVPTVAAARRWQTQIMKGLAASTPKHVGRFRGEPGLERCGVQVDGVQGAAPWNVASDLQAFEATLQRAVGVLDARYPNEPSLDDDGVAAAIELAAWAHAEWVRIHPFANGNGRTARVWANLILMRYWLPPVVTLRPRPGGAYGAAGAAAMRGQWQPTVNLFRQMLQEYLVTLGTAE